MEKGPTTPAGSLVTLRDVQRVTPMESPEESILLENIDRTDPTGKSLLFLHQAAPLPIDMTPTTEMVAQGPAKTMLHPNQPDAQTVEGELFSYTKAINLAHFETVGAEENIPPPANVYQDVHKAAKTQADLFAANAGKVFQRFSKSRQRKSTLDIEHGKKRKKRSDALDGVMEFSNLIRSNKSVMQQYAISTFVFCIIPATLLACL